MRLDAEESLTYNDEHRNVEDEVRGQIMKVQPVVEHETTDEWMKGKPQSAEEMRDENYPLIRLWCGDDLLFGREPMAISLARYPASRSSLMFFSMTEEAIHLPCAPDPDMAGVISGSREG